MTSHHGIIIQAPNKTFLARRTSVKLSTSGTEIMWVCYPMPSIGSGYIGIVLAENLHDWSHWELFNIQMRDTSKSYHRLSLLSCLSFLSIIVRSTPPHRTTQVTEYSSFKKDWTGVATSSWNTWCSSLPGNSSTSSDIMKLVIHAEKWVIAQIIQTYRHFYTHF